MKASTKLRFWFYFYFHFKVILLKEDFSQKIKISKTNETIEFFG